MTEPETTAPSNGLFIAFEGPDGSGKTTQSKYFAERLNEAGVPTLWTREPGGSRIGQQIRDILLSNTSRGFIDPPTGSDIADLTQLLLLLAERSEHLSGTVLPATTAGQWVVTDRYIDSTYVLQGAMRGFGSHLRDLERVFPQLFQRPDLTIYLQCKDDVIAQRLAHRDDNNALDRQHLARQTGAHYIRHFADLVLVQGVSTIYVIDGALPVEEIHARMDELAQYLCQDVLKAPKVS